MTFRFVIATFLATISSATFASTQRTALRADENIVTAAVLDRTHDVGYFAVEESDFRFSLDIASTTIVRFDLRNNQRTGSMKLHAGENPLTAGAVDAGGNAAYFGMYGDPNRGVPAQIIKIDLPTFRRLSATPLGKDEYGISSALAARDGKTIYWGTLYGSVIATQLPSLTVSGGLALQRENNAFLTGVLDSSGTFGYFGTASGSVAKIELEQFLPSASISMSQSAEGFHAAVRSDDGRTLFFASQGTPAQVVRIPIAGFRAQGFIPFEEGENSVVFGFTVPGTNRAYFVTGDSSPHLVALDMTTLEWVSRSSLDIPQTIRCGFYDPTTKALFLGTSGSPASIYKVALTP